MSWFASAAPTGPIIHPVQSRFTPELLFGPLEKEDTEWLCAGGFVTETQTFYATTPTGGLVMCQVIHSSLGLWYPSIQFTFRYVEPSKSIHIWKSAAVTNFISSPPKFDKRSCKSDQFTITIDPLNPTKYTIQGKYDDEVQISLSYEKLAEGWKLGAGPQGGMTYFGALATGGETKGIPVDNKSGADGYAIHRFWPRCDVSGIMIVGTEVIDLVGSRGTFIHAIQGMRPNVLASQWNFANFQSSKEGGEGIALTMMEFLTTSAYGSIKVNIGSIVVGDKLISITAGGEGITTGTGSSAEQTNAVVDIETGYAAPGKITYNWEGASLFGEESKVGSNSNKSKASVSIDLITSQPGEAYMTKGLVEKVDVLGELPYIAKKVINAAGTKPYIYTWLNDAIASVTLPADLSDATSTATKTIEVKGQLFNEATFVS